MEKVICMVLVVALALVHARNSFVYFSFANGDLPRRKVDGTLTVVRYRVQLKHSRALWMWYAPQRAFSTLESTQAQNRSGLSVFILKRKDLLEGDVCIL